MKARILAAALFGGAVAIADGQGFFGGTVRMNNFDANAGLFFGPGTTPAAAGTMVMVLGGTNLTSLTPVSSENPDPGGATIFSATYVNGRGPFTGTFFRAGYGRVPGVPGFGSAYIQLLAWYGAADFAAAQRTEGAWWYEVRWTQNVGDEGWPADLPAPLEIPVPMHMLPGIPEPSSAALAGLAVGCLALWRGRRLRRVLHLGGNQL